MPDFSYAAIDTAGRERRGRLVAADRDAAQAKLLERKLFPVRIDDAHRNGDVTPLLRRNISFRRRLTAKQLTGEIGAHIDHVRAHRVELEHLVERAGALHLGRCGVGELGDLTHGVVGNPALLLLCKMQQLDKRRLLARIAQDDLVRHLKVVSGEVAHRSTSPMIGSTLEMIATASAMRLSRMRCGMV